MGKPMSKTNSNLPDYKAIAAKLSVSPIAISDWFNSLSLDKEVQKAVEKGRFEER